MVHLHSSIVVALSQLHTSALLFLWEALVRYQKLLTTAKQQSAYLLLMGNFSAMVDGGYGVCTRLALWTNLAQEIL